MKKLAILLALPITLAVADDNSSKTVPKSDKQSEASVHLANCAIQETIPGAKVTGAFLTVQKHDDTELSVVSVQAPSVTEHVEMHEMVMKDGTMKMSQIKNYPLKKGDNFFKKGGYHIMLMDLTKPLIVDEKRVLTFTFSDGSTQSCVADVKSVEALTPKGMDMKHDHKSADSDKHEKKIDHSGHKHDDNAEDNAKCEKSHQ